MGQTEAQRKKDDIDIAYVSEDELDALLERAGQHLGERDAKLLEKVIAAYLHVLKLVRAKNTTVARLRRLFGLAKSEKTKDVLSEGDATKGHGDNSSAENDTADTAVSSASAANAKPCGHGKNGASAYQGATRTWVPHSTLNSGDPCPSACGGKVYPWADAETIVRIYGHSPISAEVWELEKFRCNVCLQFFTAKAPEAAKGVAKYDETVGASIALLHYGMGLPFHRLDQLQQAQKVPLPASTQWDIIRRYYPMVEPVFHVMVKLAANGSLLHNDDTTARILSLMGKRRQERHAKGALDKPDRTGIYTTGIVGAHEAHKIALFYTGPNHAGENIAKVLAQRQAGTGPPIQMCDGLSANVCHMFEVLHANCLAHGRRLWVDQIANFPKECRHLLETLSQVFAHEQICKETEMKPEARLAYHQTHSKPLLDDLKAWLDDLWENHKIEPNSGLGEPIAYMRKRWDKLTLFLRVKGAPLENNIVERALKKAILQRKNSLFYKTEHGADVGGLFTSLIYTAEINGANPFDYLTQLFRHPDHVAKNAAAWLPWNYTQAVATPA